MKFGSFKDSRNTNPDRKKPLRSLVEFALELKITIHQLYGHMNTTRVEKPKVVFSTHSCNKKRVLHGDNKTSGYVDYYYRHELRAWWKAHLNFINDDLLTKETEDGREEKGI